MSTVDRDEVRREPGATVGNRASPSDAPLPWSPDAGSGESALPAGRPPLGPVGTEWIPSSLRLRIASCDDAVDRLFEPYRGRPGLDAAAKIVANLSDHGFMWAVESAWRARRSRSERWRVMRHLAIAGIGSSVVNAAFKSVVSRARPDSTTLNLRAASLPVREPTSSSFPSGHTLAAFCTATVMAGGDHPFASIARFAAAGLVGWSRLHLRAHHASDVVGGMAVGMAVGAIGRLLR